MATSWDDNFLKMASKQEIRVAAVDWKGARLSVGRRGGMLGLVRRVVVAGLMVVGVVLLFWAGVHNLRARRAAIEKARQNQVTLTPAQPGGDDGAPDAEGASLKGNAAPNFTLVDLAGKKVSLADFKGHPVIVNFWATWCGPCKLEMPWFEQMYGKYKPQGLVILGLSQDQGTAKERHRFRREKDRGELSDPAAG